MKNHKLKSLITTITLSTFITVPALAQSAKFSAQVADLVLVPETVQTDSWAPLLSTTIQTPQSKDLLIGASLETGITTDTLVKSKGGNKDESNAVGEIKVRVLVDRNSDGQFYNVPGDQASGVQPGEIALPGEVTYDKRDQTLIAELGGVLESCTDGDGDGTITFEECEFTEEEIQLVLKTLAAHHFNFVMGDLPSGAHVMEVQAKITTSTSSNSGSAEASAWVGKGSLTVEEVRAIKDEDFSL